MMDLSPRLNSGRGAEAAPLQEEARRSVPLPEWSARSLQRSLKMFRKQRYQPKKDFVQYITGKGRICDQPTAISLYALIIYRRYVHLRVPRHTA
jgi:hypothetical protein